MNPREVLEARARALAAPPPAAAAETDALELATFVIDGETLALETRWVRHVAPRGAVTPLPGAAPPLVGVTAWRGTMLAVRSLRALLGRADGGDAASAWLVVVGDGAAAFALAVDAPGAFARVPADALRPPPDARPYLRGVTPDAALLLDGGALLRDHT